MVNYIIVYFSLTCHRKNHGVCTCKDMQKWSVHECMVRSYSMCLVAVTIAIQVFMCPITSWEQEVIEGRRAFAFVDHSIMTMTATSIEVLEPLVALD